MKFTYQNQLEKDGLMAECFGVIDAVTALNGSQCIRRNKLKVRTRQSCERTRVCCGIALLLSGFAVGSVSAQVETTIKREYDPVTGLLSSETRDGNVKTSFTYDADRNLATVTDPRGFVTRYTNYKRGIPQTEVHAEGTPAQATLHREVNDVGCVISSTDGEGNKTSFTRDAICRPLFIDLPEPGTSRVSYTYLPASSTAGETHTITRGNYTKTSVFDAFGRLSETVAGDVKQIYFYDTLGRTTFESYPHNPTQSEPNGEQYRYDGLNRVREIMHTADESLVTLGFTSTAYGAPQIDIRNERGHITSQVFRVFGNADDVELMGIVSPVAAANINIKRNVNGQTTEVAQGGVIRQYGYDSRYYLVSTTNPETGTTELGRDNAGNLISLKVGTSGTTTFDLDGLGQAYEVRYPDNTKSVKQVWDKNGRLKSASSTTSTRAWVYNGNGRLKQDSLSVAGHEFTTSYSYDNNDRMASITYPKKGSVLDLSPDIFGRPSKVGTFVQSATYHPTGMLNTVTFGNGVISVYKKDARQRPANLQTGKGGGSGYVGMTLGYDTTGNLSTVADSANSLNNRNYGYDAIDRLTSIVDNGVTYPIVYDGVGNIRQQNFGGVLNYTYDSGTNRLTGTTGVKTYALGYDVRGNVVSNGSILFEYDDNSRLRCAKCNSANPIIYDYDPIGVRISRSQGGNTVYQVHDLAGDLILEFNPTNNQRQEHIYLHGQRVATSTQSALFATSVSLSVSSSASLAATASVSPGGSVRLSATVSGGRSPDGTVNFYDNGVFIGSASLISGVATFTTQALNFGYHSFSASYESDGSNSAATTAAAMRVEVGNVTGAIMQIVNELLLDD